MSRCKDYTKYPPEYFEVLSAFEAEIAKVGEEKARTQLKFETVKEAVKFRLEFYSYKGALERDEAAMSLFPHCNYLVMTLEGTTITVLLRDQQSHVIAVRKALEAMRNEDV